MQMKTWSKRSLRDYLDKELVAFVQTSPQIQTKNQKLLAVLLGFLVLDKIHI